MGDFPLHTILCPNHPTLQRPPLPYPEIVPLSALIGCNAMNWPGGDALSFSYRFHHWLMLYTLGQYIVNVQSSTTSDGFLTIFIFGIWAHPYTTPSESPSTPHPRSAAHLPLYALSDDHWSGRYASCWNEFLFSLLKNVTTFLQNNFDFQLKWQARVGNLWILSRRTWRKL